MNPPTLESRYGADVQYLGLSTFMRQRAGVAR